MHQKREVQLEAGLLSMDCLLLPCGLNKDCVPLVLKATVPCTMHLCQMRFVPCRNALLQPFLQWCVFIKGLGLTCIRTILPYWSQMLFYLPQSACLQQARPECSQLVCEALFSPKSQMLCEFAASSTNDFKLKYGEMAK